MSTGLWIANCALYSTLPFAFFGASGDVGDDRVAAVGRVDLAVRRAAQQLVGADGAERLAVGYGRRRVDGDPDDAGFGAPAAMRSALARATKVIFLREGAVMSFLSLVALQVSAIIVRGTPAVFGIRMFDVDFRLHAAR